MTWPHYLYEAAILSARRRIGRQSDLTRTVTTEKADWELGRQPGRQNEWSQRWIEEASWDVKKRSQSLTQRGASNLQ